MNPFEADPATTTFTYFYQSAHNADRSAITVEVGSQSSTGPAMPANFVAAARATKNRRR